MLVWAMIIAAKRRQKLAQTAQLVAAAAAQDPVWQETALTTRVQEVFLRFQNDWSTYNVGSMKDYLSESYWKRMVLELNVLQNEQRKNAVENPRIICIEILDAFDDSDDTKDRFTAVVSASAHDVLLDTETNTELYVDNSAFAEYWDFVRDGAEWKLDLIRQSTENASLAEPEIAEFARKHDFFYDPDFGWLMMPNKGVIFSASNFKTSDINNHVVGYYRDKIVEFYTFVPAQNGPNYVVAQVALPIKYHDILVRRKGWLNIGPRGLRRIETESNEFEAKFCLWAHPEDQISSFELLTPNFMEKVFELPFELNIEVVGSFLYLYAKGRTDIEYAKMLEILSWAFDEMKM